MKKIEVKIQHSPYQKAVFDWICKGSGNAIISAVAGSGKTTTLIDALASMAEGTKCLFLSFNKEICLSTRDKITKRKIKGVYVFTNHGFGYQTIMASKNFVKPDCDNWKYEKIYDELFLLDAKRIHDAKSCEQDWNKCGCSEEYLERKAAILNFIEYSRLFCERDEHCIVEAMEYMGVKPSKTVPIKEMHRIAMELIDRGSKILARVDFLDMLLLPPCNSLAIQKFDFILLDECQDLNVAQIELVKYAIQKTGARLLAVGDPKQAIYGFAGALPNSWQMVRDAFHAQEFPLSVCYRCGKSIVALAKKIVQVIESNSESKDGAVLNIKEFSVDFILENVDAVLSRFHAPLVSLLCESVAKTNRFKLLGSDIALEFSGYIKRLPKNKILTLVEKIRLFFSNKIKKSKSPFEEKKWQDLSEAILFFESISDHTENGLIETIQEHFTEKPKKGEIILSTIHKAKGREWGSVLILSYNKMPCHFKDSPEWQEEQETNLKYIAITRAMNTLYCHCPMDFRSDFQEDDFEEDNDWNHVNNFNDD